MPTSRTLLFLQWLAVGAVAACATPGPSAVTVDVAREASFELPPPNNGCWPMVYQEYGQWWPTATQPSWSEGRVLALEEHEDGIGYYGDIGAVVDSILNEGVEYRHFFHRWEDSSGTWVRRMADSVFAEQFWIPFWGPSLHGVSYPCDMDW